MSYGGVWLILAAILLRFLLRWVPKNIRCILWGMVGIRLLCPFFVESDFSLIPSTQTVGRVVEELPLVPSAESDAAEDRTVRIAELLQGSYDRYDVSEGEDRTAVSATGSGGAGGVGLRQSGRGADRFERACFASACVWAAGMLILALYAGISYLRLHRNVREGVRLRGNVWLCDRIGSPFVLGLLRPRIYLPSAIEGEQMFYILAHERAHLKRRDHLWKPLGYVLLMLHWFNPLVWVAYILLCKDIELACDERVIREYDAQEKKRYSNTLLECSVSRRSIAACPLAFGEVSVKERVRSVLDYKKPQFWAVVVAVILCVVVGVGFLTNPKAENATPEQTDLTEIRSAESDSLEAADPDASGTEAGAREEAADAEEMDDAELMRVARAWGKAFCDRDGNRIAELSSEQVREDLKNRDLLQGEPGNYGFGYSSPWPWDSSEDYMINECRGYTVELLYYAKTSDPHITVWGEMLTFEPAGDSYVVVDEELKSYDHIASGEEFAKVCSFITNTPLDYTANGMGEYLNQNALLSSSMMYRDLFEPKSAAIALLNLLDNPGKVELTLLSEDSGSGNVGVEIHFLEDDVTATISMVQPYGRQGIWVPVNYYVDALGRFMKIPWDEIEARNLKVEDYISGAEDIQCIGELPEYGIRMYGYNDEETSDRGVAIQIGGDVNYFDWYYTGPRGFLPRLYWDESSRQLYVSLYSGSGTGVSFWELHVLQQYDTGTLEDHTFGYEDYSALMQEKLGYRFDEKSGMLNLFERADGREVAAIELSDWKEKNEELGDIVGISWGIVSQFVLGDTVYFQVNPGVVRELRPVEEFDDMPILEAPVAFTYDENGELAFDLGEFRIVDGWE